MTSAVLCLPYVLLSDCTGPHHLQAENGGSSAGGLRAGTTGGRSEWVGDPKAPCGVPALSAKLWMNQQCVRAVVARKQSCW